MIKYSKEYFEGISTKNQLINFLNELSRDFSKNNSEWQNTTINEYLSSIAAWVEDYRFEKDYEQNWDQVSGFISLVLYGKNLRISRVV